MNARIDITNNVYGNLTALTHVSINNSGRMRSCWICRCICGKEISVRRENLVSGRYKSCGCVKRKENTHTKSDKWIYNKYKHNAKMRNKSFSLEIDYFSALIHSNCFYCGLPPSNGRNNKYSGIDRKDNNIGYEIKNCIPCCKKCNFLKSTYSFEEFTSIISLIYNNLNKLLQVNL